jgi:hypothetical protein
MVTPEASEAAAVAIRAFIARAGGRADGECCRYHPDDQPHRALIDAQSASVAFADLKRLTPTEIEELAFHAHRLCNGLAYVPVSQKLRAADMAPLARGRRRAFESGPRSYERIGHLQIVIRWGRLFTFGTHDERASLDSVPTYERAEARLLLNRLRALDVLNTEISPYRWKKWVPLGKQSDLVARAQAVLRAVVHHATSGPAESVSVHDCAWLGRLCAILIAERGQTSLELLVQVAETFHDMRRWLAAHVEDLRAVPELAPIVAATVEPGT